jgi:glycosyltransferase involved in cell wall biosynthesis
MALPVFRRAARITAVSRFLADDIQRLLPALEAEVEVTPMPVDVDSFSRARASPATPARILFAGNLVPSKGVDVLLRAGGELQRRGVQFELKILGEGPLKSQLRALASELGIGGRVTWSPFVPQTQMPAEYAAATVTVLPSRGHAEGLGLTLVEALLAGSAVVATAAGGIPEVVIHERTGLVARDGDPIDLADQLQRILGSPDLRDRLARSGRDHVLGTYAPDVAIRRFLEIYHAAADAHPHR